MKIVSLVAENFKRLVAVQIDPQGNLVEITGCNGAGKSSVLDAVWAAIGGKDALPEKPIRDGQEVAKITLDLGEVKVTRKFINKDDVSYTTSLTVETADGARYPSPQDFLSKLMGALTFDPLEFTRMKEKDQARMLRAFVPGFDFDRVEKEVAELEESRRDTNRALKQANAALAAVQIPAEPAPAPDEDEIAQRLTAAYNLNLERADATAKRDSFVNSIQFKRERLETIADQMSRLANEKNIVEAEIIQLEAGLEAAPAVLEEVDLEAIREEARAARAATEANARYRDALARQKDAQAQVKALTDASEAATTKITELRQSVVNAVQSAALPVPGLVFDENGVALNGIPFEQVSQAEQLRASIAVATALNPKLRVIRVKEGALLDSDAMVQLAAFAAEFDVQIWCETIESSRPTAIQIVDGQIAGAE